MKQISMRNVFAQLVRECGPVEGPQIFEWYCTAYKVTATDPAPASIVREVFGI